MSITFQNLNKYFTLTQIFILVLVIHVVSCSNNKQKDQGTTTGSLTMEVSPLRLDPAHRTTTATFQLIEPGETVDLANFTLKAKITKEEGGTGSQISYQNAAGIRKDKPTIDEPLTDFASFGSLKADDASLKIDFTVIPGERVTLLVYEIEAFNLEGHSIGSYSVEYKAEKKLPTLNLASEGVLYGAEKKIKLEISNANVEPITGGTLKLQITRTKGTRAMIVGSSSTHTPYMYEVSIDDVLLGGQTLTKTLTIDSKTDLEAMFDIRLVQGKAQSDLIVVVWKQDIQLDLAVKYEGNPRKLSYIINNKGTKEVSNIRLQYTCKSDGVRLAGVTLKKDEIKEIVIGHIGVNEKIENQDLGELDLGANENAKFIFKVVYDVGHTEEKELICSAINVQLSIENLAYNSVKNEITYSIRNKGGDTAEKVQVRYANESQDEAGKKVMIANQAKGATDVVSVSSASIIGPLNLPIDFKQADEAKFKFELLYKGSVITQATETKIFKAKEIKLKLVPIGNISITGGTHVFKFRIAVEPDSRPMAGIDLKHVQLNITNSTGNTSFVTKTAGATQGINKLTGADLNNIRDEITLYVDPKTEKEAKFVLELSYKNNPQGNPLTINWQEENIQIEYLNSFVGDNQASFKLCSTVTDIDHGQLTVELSSNNKAKFSLIKEDKHDGGTSLTLDQLIGAGKTPINHKTYPTYFKLLDSQGEVSAQVTVHLKRGAKELVSKTVDWKVSRNSLGIVIAGDSFADEELFKINIKNKGSIVNLDKIKFKLTNDQGVAFRVGKLPGSTAITATLENITGQVELVEEGTIQFDLQRDAAIATKVYGVDLIIELLDDETGKTLEKLRLEWINQAEIDIKLNLLLKDLKTLKKTFENNLQAATETNQYDIKVKAVENIITINEKLDQLTLESSKIYLSVASKEKKKAIKQILIKPTQKLIQEIEEKTIDFLETGRSELQRLSKELKNNVDGFYSTIRAKDNRVPIGQRKELVGQALSNKIAKIDSLYSYMVTIASKYNMDKTKGIAEEVEKIVKEAKEKVSELGKAIDEAVSSQ
ncbi:MAG: hypothetical protein BGO68_05845 [Candidatus Amoebophilus sp. 36-38]|nr:MAG: hypothetical protein BGO68_05845 [Candidatus Amoebophilus sp. 36-38]